MTEPFSGDFWAELHRWLSSSPVVSTTTGFPIEGVSITTFELNDPLVRSWAVFENPDAQTPASQALSSNSKPCGFVAFERIGRMGGRGYIASDRAVWGRGLMDEAVELAIRELYTDNSELRWMLNYVLANNYPARAFVERLGFTLKNILPGFAQSNNKSVDMLIYELTRETWKARLEASTKSSTLTETDKVSVSVGSGS
jgi:RimJ/RimL family protein N-acetyltransferase